MLKSSVSKRFLFFRMSLHDMESVQTVCRAAALETAAGEEELGALEAGCCLDEAAAELLEEAFAEAEETAEAGREEPPEEDAEAREEALREETALCVGGTDDAASGESENGCAAEEADGAVPDL